MLFAIHALDGNDVTDKRKAVYDEHRSHLGRAGEQGITILAAGPLVTDDGATSIGSLLLVEAADRATAEAFNRADPFSKAGVWQSVHIHVFANRRGIGIKGQ